MIEFSDAFKDELAKDASRLCWCWIIERSDGVRFGFTDHDQPVTVLGVVCEASAAGTMALVDQRQGFAIDHSEMTAALRGDQIMTDDITAGVFNGAAVQLYRVSWAEPGVNAHIWSGHIGKIERRAQDFTFELVGQAEQLQQSTGRVFSRLCDAELGDSRCGVDLLSWPEGTSCPKTFMACRDQFSNAVNFRGFPYLIGDDAMQAGPEQAPKRDGSSRYR